MSVYMIVEVKEVTNKEKYGEYILKVPQTIEKFGGKYLTSRGQVIVVTGNWNPAKIGIVEFESMDKMRAWLNSPEYRLISPLREQSTKTNAIVVEGL